jgi:uncharacterized membrane protein
LRLYLAAKTFHLLGIAAFLGSVFAHIAVSVLPGATSDPQTILVVRRAIEGATRFVTLPGLVLAIGSGIALTWLGRRDVRRNRWLAVHQIIGVLVAINAFLILAPTGREALALAEAAYAQGASLAPALTVAAREAQFGPINVVLTILTVALAVFRPRLGARDT